MTKISRFTVHHDIIEILLKVALNIINQPTSVIYKYSLLSLHIRLSYYQMKCVKNDRCFLWLTKGHTLVRHCFVTDKLFSIHILSFILYRSKLTSHHIWYLIFRLSIDIMLLSKIHSHNNNKKIPLYSIC